MVSLAIPTWSSVPHEIVHVSRAGTSCTPAPSTGRHRGSLRKDRRIALRLKAGLPAKRNGAAPRKAEGPVMIRSFNKYLLSTYYMPVQR